MHMTTPTVALTEEEHYALEAAWTRSLTPDADHTVFTRMCNGKPVDCTPAVRALMTRGFVTIAVHPVFGPEGVATTSGLHALGRMTTEEILTLDMGGTYDGLRVTHRKWTREQSEAAEAKLAGKEATFHEYTAVLGTPAEITLTGDGRAYQPQWCTCPDQSSVVRFERYTAEGRVAHGWLHAECRQLVQSG